MSDDEQIKSEIEAQLYADSRINAEKITVEVFEREVRIGGAVSSIAALEAVQVAVQNVKNIKNVKNEIIILYDGDALPDSIVFSHVNNLLRLDRNINPEFITISVEQGVATLSGSVHSYWEKLYCEKVLGTVEGVRQIINELTVVISGNATDNQIANQIREALQRIDATEIEQVTIMVENGVVNLTGKVPNWNAYYSTEYAARHTHGVLDVKNQLLLSY